MLAALIGRHDMTVSVMHDRNPMFVKTADGSIRNALTVHIVNRQSATRRFAIRLDRPQDGRLAVVGDQQTLDGSPTVEVGPDQVLELRMLVTIPPGASPPPSQQLVFKVTDFRPAGRRRPSTISLRRDARDQGVDACQAMKL